MLRLLVEAAVRFLVMVYLVVQAAAVRYFLRLVGPVQVDKVMLVVILMVHHLIRLAAVVVGPGPLEQMHLHRQQVQAAMGQRVQ
jgi:hypothetical protein